MHRNERWGETLLSAGTRRKVYIGDPTNNSNCVNRIISEAGRDGPALYCSLGEATPLSA